MANTNRYKESIKTLCETGHRTAEQVHKQIKKEFPWSLIGIGTIYRNLTELVNEGVLMKHHELGDKMIYETNKPHHGHIFCQYTGTIQDIDISSLVLNTITLPSTFCLSDIQVTFAGHFKGEKSEYCKVNGKLLR